MGDRRFFDDMARVATGAAGALGGIRSRMEGELRDQAERLLARMNLVTCEEFEVVSALARAARTEQEKLAERVAALEAQLQSISPAAASSAETPPRAARPKRAAKATPARRRRGES